MCEKVHRTLLNLANVFANLSPPDRSIHSVFALDSIRLDEKEGSTIYLLPTFFRRVFFCRPEESLHALGGYPSYLWAWEFFVELHDSCPKKFDLSEQELLDDVFNMKRLKNYDNIYARINVCCTLPRGAIDTRAFFSFRIFGVERRVYFSSVCLSLCYCKISLFWRCARCFYFLGPCDFNESRGWSWHWNSWLVAVICYYIVEREA